MQNTWHHCIHVVEVLPEWLQCQLRGCDQSQQVDNPTTQIAVTYYNSDLNFVHSVNSESHNFGDESFQATSCTGTHNSKLTREKTAINHNKNAKQTIWTIRKKKTHKIHKNHNEQSLVHVCELLICVSLLWLCTVMVNSTKLMSPGHEGVWALRRKWNEKHTLLAFQTIHHVTTTTKPNDGHFPGVYESAGNSQKSPRKLMDTARAEFFIANPNKQLRGSRAATNIRWYEVAN